MALLALFAALGMFYPALRLPVSATASASPDAAAGHAPAAGPAVVRASYAAPLRPLGWSGTITQTFEHRTDAPRAGLTRRITASTTVTLRRDGTATATARYESVEVSTYGLCNGKAVGKTTVTETGSMTGLMAVRIDTQGAPLSGGGSPTPPRDFFYDLGWEKLRVPTVVTAVTESSQPSCPPPNGGTNKNIQTTGRDFVRDQTTRPNAEVLQGTFQDKQDCSPNFECVETDTVTWKLSRRQTLEIATFELLDRDPLHSQRTAGEIKNGRTPKEFAELEYLSASPHAYHGGRTLIWGNLRLKGLESDLVREVELEIRESGRLIDKVELEYRTSRARDMIVGQYFNRGPAIRRGTLSTRTNGRLFELDSSLLAKFGQRTNGEIELRLRVTTLWDTVASRAVDVEKLVRFNGDEISRQSVCGSLTGWCRYGPRDEAYGGDDWALPDTVRAVKQLSASGHLRGSVFGLAWGDFSNMNGGRFSPHGSHRAGVDVDGIFKSYYKVLADGSEQVTAEAAEALRDIIVAGDGDIERIYVTYSRNPCDAFCQAIKRPLPGGGRISTYIGYEKNHADHFHIRFKK